MQGRQIQPGVCVQELGDTALAGPEQRWAVQSALLKPPESFLSPQHLCCGLFFFFCTHVRPFWERALGGELAG